MFNFEELKSAKNKVKAHQEQNTNVSDSLLEKALEEFESLQYEKPSKEKLKNLGEQFIEVIKYKRTIAEPYICLAYIYYLIKNDKIAFKYLRIAESIDKNSPAISNLKEMLVTG